MLLNYLYTHFCERSDFCATAQISSECLAELEAAKLVPKASYIVQVDLAATSFVAQHNEQKTYSFYRKEQLDWLAEIDAENINTEAAARTKFDTQYNAAIELFLQSKLGKNIANIFPKSQWNLSDYADTWVHFTNGTYGLCTTTGLPNEIFKKHIYIRFIEFITAANQPHEIPNNILNLLKQAVNALDEIEADFAPHEVALSSRQRCIINIKEQYLT